eukprot:CAMPEP_0172329860 /NCGR_PEP_ID=MMETSP1058-20130122/61101_1 /TAXON_ID=83371 /ORGANISM="Detonula confervacea, Strain CCMP 353" /LENGTH=662 /DNA_ID=CAMNT_0013047053 /DNA_START=26 /DNA_END=2014 /DNA_ORIENTATION=-
MNSNDNNSDSDPSSGGENMDHSGNPGNNTISGNDGGDDGNSNASDDEAQSHGDGGRSSSHFMEGYTPLNFNMNTLAMMHEGSDESDSEGDGTDANIDEETDGELFANGYYHMMGAPPRRLNGVKDRMPGLAMPHDYEEDGASNHTHDSSGIENSHNDDHAGRNSPGSVEVPDDFLLLAEQALRGLEVEHLSTLERSMDVGDTPDRTADTSNESVNEPTPVTEFEASFPSFDEKLVGINIQTDENAVDSADTEAAVPAQKIEPATVAKIQLKEPKPLKSKPMNVDAIQCCMQSIRLKSPQLATTLDAGASSSFSTNAAHVATDAALNAIINSTSQAIKQSHEQQSTTHTIIPAGPLAAFRRNTAKAQAATANLTRSGTLSEVVHRLWPLICFRRRMRVMGLGGLSQEQMNPCSKTLTIHILGADGVECTSEKLVHKSVGSFVRWMDAALHSGALANERQEGAPTGMPPQDLPDGIDSLLIEFSGPNMPSALLGKVLDLLPQLNSGSSKGLVSAKAIFQQREYHEVSSYPDSYDVSGIDAPSAADIAIAFNAGIWGYDSWKPTIACMLDAKDNGTDGNNSGIGKTLFVITAYTVEECEDDAEVVAEVVQDFAAEQSSSPSAIARQLWAPETNPFSSRLERKTSSAPPGRKYFENGAWQAWLLGL